MAGSAPALDPACIFCKIVAGQIPCYKVYEDQRVLAFLDVGPLARGHTLIIPKAHFATVDAMPEDWVTACTALAPRLSRAVLQATGAKAWQFLQNNGGAAQQSVGHVHFHIIPRQEGDGLGYRWMAKNLDKAAAPALVEAIKAAI